MIVDKFLQWIERTRSRIYGVFAFWLIIGFSPIIFTSLFVDQKIIYEKTGLLKNEYIRQQYLNLQSVYTYLYVGLVIVASAFLTYLMIWKFPNWFVNKAYSKEIEAHYERERKRLEEKQKLEEMREEVAKKQLDAIETEKRAAVKEEELGNKEENEWLKEYRQFKKSDLFDDFDWIVQSIFNNYGSIHRRLSGGQTFRVPNNILAYAQGAELVDLKIGEGTISLTRKGNFFLKNFQLDTLSKN